MGQQSNGQQGDRDERSVEAMARHPEEDQPAALPDTAMGTGNDDPIDNWATPPASGSIGTGAGNSATSGSNDATDEIGAPTDVEDSHEEEAEGYDSNEPHRQGVGTQATYMSQQPRNSE